MTTNILGTTIYMTVAAIIVATAAGIGASFNRFRLYRNTAHHASTPAASIPERP